MMPALIRKKNAQPTDEEEYYRSKRQGERMLTCKISYQSCGRDRTSFQFLEEA